MDFWFDCCNDKSEERTHDTILKNNHLQLSWKPDRAKGKDKLLQHRYHFMDSRLGQDVHKKRPYPLKPFEDDRHTGSRKGDHALVLLNGPTAYLALEIRGGRMGSCPKLFLTTLAVPFGLAVAEYA